MIKRPKTERPSTALGEQSESYPSGWKGRVPAQGRIIKHVRGLAFPGHPRLTLNPDDEVELWINGHGAASAWINDAEGARLLGLKPDEFEIVGWYAALLSCGDGCTSGIRYLSGHRWHCPECNAHLSSLYLCDNCNRRWYPWPTQQE